MRLEELSGRRVLVPLSGGLDSVHVLWSVLAWTKCAVIAHHVASHVSLSLGPEVDRINPNARRADAQAEAAARCAAWIKANVRDFEMTTTRLERRYALKADVEEATLIAPAIAFAALAEGLGGEDVILLGWNSGDIIPDPIPEAHLRTAYLDSLARGRGVPAVSWLEPYTKAQRAAELPKALAHLTSSCRDPFEMPSGGWVPCTRCYACKALEPHFPERYGEAADPFKHVEKDFAVFSDRLDQVASVLAKAAEMEAESDRRMAELRRQLMPSSSGAG